MVLYTEPSKHFCRRYMRSTKFKTQWCTSGSWCSVYCRPCFSFTNMSMLSFALYWSSFMAQNVGCTGNRRSQSIVPAEAAGINWYQFVSNAEVRWRTSQSLLTSTVQSWRLPLGVQHEWTTVDILKRFCLCFLHKIGKDRQDILISHGWRLQKFHNLKLTEALDVAHCGGCWQRLVPHTLAVQDTSDDDDRRRRLMIDDWFCSVYLFICLFVYLFICLIVWLIDWFDLIWFDWWLMIDGDDDDDVGVVVVGSWTMLWTSALLWYGCQSVVAVVSTLLWTASGPDAVTHHFLHCNLRDVSEWVRVFISGT